MPEHVASAAGTESDPIPTQTPSATAEAETPMRRIAYLDGWRGLAILSVLLAHFGSTRGLNLGRFGVELFFVLSGRLMAEILFVRNLALPTFYWRRFSRVYPALVVLAVILMLTTDFRDGDPTFGQFITSVTFTANYGQFWVGHSRVLDHIWSLCIEEHVYLLLGFIAFLNRRYAVPVMAICAVLVCAAVLNGAIQTLQGLDYYAVYWRTDVRGASILMGVMAFLMFRQAVPTYLSWKWLPVLLGVVALMLNHNHFPDPIKYSIGSALLATSLALLPQAPSIVLNALEHPLLLRVGVWSYSLYLWQQPFAKAEGGDWSSRMLNLGFAVGAALLSFYLVEQPARKLLNRAVGAWPKRKPPAAESVQIGEGAPSQAG